MTVKGVDGSGAAEGPSSAGPNSGQGTIPGTPNPGTWADHTDIRPTMLALVGLHDDYLSDGRVLVEDLTPAGTPVGLRAPGIAPLAACYKQLNSSVGQFGTNTLAADTKAVSSGSAVDDTKYTLFLAGLGVLADARDQVATAMKTTLNQALSGGSVSPGTVTGLTVGCQALVGLSGILPNIG